MKKVLVVIAILATAAACGEQSAALHSSSAGSAPAPVAQSGKGTAGSTVPGSTDYAPNQLPAVTVQGPQVIRQGQVTVNVASGSFDSKLAAVRALVAQQQGFVTGTDAQSSQADGRVRSGVITFMVPADKFDATIDSVVALGKLQNEHVTGQDVSAQYVDLQARLANAEAQRQAMLTLLGRAQSVSDIIAIQTQLGQITQQIEELKGQILYLDRNTAYATVTVNLVEVGAPVQPAPADPWGFVTALSDAAHNFVTTINYIVSGLGAIGPVVILLGLGYLLWRRRGSPGLKHA